MARAGGGGKTGAILLILLLLGAVGGWNYHRNWSAEEQEMGPRPLSGYDDEGLAKLAAAYRMEIEALERQHAAARGQHAEARKRTFLSESVQEFERVQRSSRQMRGLAGEVAQREGRLREIEKEQQYRDRLATEGVQLHLGRLLGI
jgi:hypothetical protein